MTGVEHLPMPPAIGSEAVPTLPPIDAAFERGQERFEQAAELGAAVADATSSATAIATAVPLASPVQGLQTQANPGASPMVAADEDLIEKEWVDKAKQIVEQTKDDPHARTEQVNELQKDYLQKRYGKVVGAGS